ncbi:MAG: hypothetical protein WAR83_15245 [Flavobacteriales bacterium]|jgi:hypothetical protein
MKNTLLTPAFLTLALATSTLAHGERVGNLHLKVDLHIEAILLDEARIILLPENGETTLMENIGTAIDFDLDLGTAYLLEFQRSGCVSRQLMVDTRVPRNVAVTSFTSLANMKLVVPKRGQDFEFDGPVGYIYYNEEAGAFLFHTDFRVVGEQAMIDRMSTERERFAQADAVVVLPKRGYIIHPDYEYGTKVTTGVNNAPMVHRTSHEKSGEQLAQVEELAPVPMVALSVPAPVAPIAKVVEAIPTRTPIVMFDPSISEELTVTRARVIKDVTVSREGRTTTYRKVTEHYGAIFFFKNGVSCSEYVYQFGTAPVSQPAFPTMKCNELTCSR